MEQLYFHNMHTYKYKMMKLHDFQCCADDTRSCCTYSAYNDVYMTDHCIHAMQHVICNAVINP